MPLSQFKSLSGPKVYVRDFPAGLPILFGAITLAGQAGAVALGGDMEMMTSKGLSAQAQYRTDLGDTEIRCCFLLSAVPAGLRVGIKQMALASYVGSLPGPASETFLKFGALST